MVDFKNPNCIVVNFPPYAGGKFIINCLSLSKYTHPQSAIGYLIDHPDDYDYRFNLVMKTLPPVTEMSNWRCFELGNSKKQDLVWGDWAHNGKFAIESEPGFGQLDTSELKFFLVNHSAVEDLLNSWTNATVIALQNYQKFQQLAVKLKSTDTELLQNLPPTTGFSYDAFKYNFKNDVVLFDIDHCIFDRSVFLSNMEQLYKDLGFDDFDDRLIDQFYCSYMELHV
jgi:hypothetical protein